MDIAVRPGRPVSAVQPLAGGKFSLQLGGLFAPDWVGGLCWRLSQRRIDVERGYARQVQRGVWEAMFTVRPLIPGLDLAQIDFLEMANAPKPPGPSIRPGIRSFKLTDNSDSVAVSIRAADQLGLLAQLLSVFSLQMLFVHDMKIETAIGEAHDVFSLKALAGRPPSLESRRLLKAALQAMTVAGTAAVPGGF